MSLFKNRRLFDAHLHLQRQECRDVVDRAAWEAGRYFVGAGERLNVYIHFAGREDVEGIIPRPSVREPMRRPGLQNGVPIPKAVSRSGITAMPNPRGQDLTSKRRIQDMTTTSRPPIRSGKSSIPQSGTRSAGYSLPAPSLAGAKVGHFDTLNPLALSNGRSDNPLGPTDRPSETRKIVASGRTPQYPLNRIDRQYHSRPSRNPPIAPLSRTIPRPLVRSRLSFIRSSAY